tara:strand:- start:1934 stop:2167 length:234 start_codon:yes stop_codon:yes gene_type:complete
MKLEELTVMTPKKFSILIEDLVKKDKISYMDAIVHYCQVKKMEPEAIKPLVSKPLKEKLEADARRLNYLPKISQLPI